MVGFAEQKSKLGHYQMFAQPNPDTDFGRMKLKQIAQFSDPVYVWANGYALEMVERADADATVARRIQSSIDHRIESLVRVTAHECAHRWLFLQGTMSRKSRRYGTARRGGSEHQTVWHEKELWKAFEAKRDELLEAWSKEPAKRAVKPKPSIKEQRAEAARQKLAEWTRKQKLAATKVRKYKQKVRYYERTLEVA